MKTADEPKKHRWPGAGYPGSSECTRCADLEKQLHQANMEWGEAERLRRAEAARITALEDALRKVDEIRHELKKRRNNYHTSELVAALKAPCTEVEK